MPAPPVPALLQAGLSGTDWTGVGIVLAIVGAFVLANAILYRHPRALIEERFRGARPSLRAIREVLVHRVQVHLGFLLLLVGFALELYGRYAVRGPRAFPVQAVGLVLLAVVALEVGAWWLSHALFRRHVREWFLQNPPDFETDIALAREVGTLFGMRTSGDETVSSYAARLRRELGLPDPGRRERPTLVGEPEEDLA